MLEVVRWVGLLLDVGAVDIDIRLGQSLLLLLNSLRHGVLQSLILPHQRLRFELPLVELRIGQDVL